MGPGQVPRVPPSCPTHLWGAQPLARKGERGSGGTGLVTVRYSISFLPQQVNGQQGGGSEPAAAVVAAGDRWKPPQVLTFSIRTLRPACPPACLRIPGPRETWLGAGWEEPQRLLCFWGRGTFPALWPPTLGPGSGLLFPVSPLASTLFVCLMWGGNQPGSASQPCPLINRMVP